MYVNWGGGHKSNICSWKLVKKHFRDFVHLLPIQPYKTSSSQWKENAGVLFGSVGLIIERFI